MIAKLKAEIGDRVQLVGGNVATREVRRHSSTPGSTP